MISRDTAFRIGFGGLFAGYVAFRLWMSPSDNLTSQLLPDRHSAPPVYAELSKEFIEHSPVKYSKVRIPSNQAQLMVSEYMNKHPVSLDNVVADACRVPVVHGDIVLQTDLDGDGDEDVLVKSGKDYILYTNTSRTDQ
jgi:hypothetical protein